MEDLIAAMGMPLITAVVPVAVAAIKRLLPRLPKPLLPVLAAALGPAADALLAWLASVPVIGWQAALLGLAGVGLREVVDQTAKALKPKE